MSGSALKTAYCPMLGGMLYSQHGKPKPKAAAPLLQRELPSDYTKGGDDDDNILGLNRV